MKKSHCLISPNVLFVLFILGLHGCSNNQNKFTTGSWIQVSQKYNPPIKDYENKFKSECIIKPIYTNFNSNGEVVTNNYQFNCYYRIEGDNIFFGRDSVGQKKWRKKPFKIIKSKSDEIILELEDSVYQSDKRKIYTKITEKYIKCEPIKSSLVDTFFYEFSKIYYINEPDTINFNTLLFSFDARRYNGKKFIIDDPFALEPIIKGRMDKLLKTLPKEEKKDQVGFGGGVYNYYEWETTDWFIVMQNSFKNSYLTENEGQTMLESKLWVTNKNVPLSEMEKFKQKPISPKSAEEKRILDSINIADSLAMVDAEQQRISKVNKHSKK